MRLKHEPAASEMEPKLRQRLIIGGSAQAVSSPQPTANEESRQVEAASTINLSVVRC